MPDEANVRVQKDRAIIAFLEALLEMRKGTGRIESASSITLLVRSNQNREVRHAIGYVLEQMGLNVEMVKISGRPQGENGWFCKFEGRLPHSFTREDFDLNRLLQEHGVSRG